MKLEHEGHTRIFAGCYDEQDDLIWIASGLPRLEAEVIYYHERQHRECYKRGCKCYKQPNDIMCEYHAMKGEVTCVLVRGSVAIAKAYLRSVQRFDNKAAGDPDGWKDHIRAMKRVKRLKVFAAVCRLAEGKRR